MQILRPLTKPPYVEFDADLLTLFESATEALRQYATAKEDYKDAKRAIDNLDAMASLEEAQDAKNTHESASIDVLQKEARAIDAYRAYLNAEGTTYRRYHKSIVKDQYRTIVGQCLEGLRAIGFDDLADKTRDANHPSWQGKLEPILENILWKYNPSLKDAKEYADNADLGKMHGDANLTFSAVYGQTYRDWVQQAEHRRAEIEKELRERLMR